MSETRDLAYATLDVFSSVPFKGNQLAVVQVPPEIKLTHETRQAVAKEFNFSETVFVQTHASSSTTDNSQAPTWDVWIYTPVSELPFAGHPTIGTACYLVARDPSLNKANLLTKAGLIPIAYVPVDGGLPEATATVPQTHHIHKGRITREQLLKLQPGLVNQEKLAKDFPMVSITDGMNFGLYELDSIETLNSPSASSLHREDDFVALDQGWAPTQYGSYFYYVDEAESTEEMVRVHTRMIEKNLEDPATGSAACTLAGYLTIERKKRGLMKGDVLYFDIEQGKKMGRESHIGVRIALDSNGAVKVVHLRGRSVWVTSGVFQC